jgi:hypothetical protein
MRIRVTSAAKRTATTRSNEVEAIASPIVCADRSTMLKRRYHDAA